MTEDIKSEDAPEPGARIGICGVCGGWINYRETDEKVQDA